MRHFRSHGLTKRIQVNFPIRFRWCVARSPNRMAGQLKSESRKCDNNKPIELCAKVIEKKLCSFFRSTEGERNRIENRREISNQNRKWGKTLRFKPRFLSCLRLLKVFAFVWEFRLNVGAPSHRCDERRATTRHLVFLRLKWIYFWWIVRRFVLIRKCC